MDITDEMVLAAGRAALDGAFSLEALAAQLGVDVEELKAAVARGESVDLPMSNPERRLYIAIQRAGAQSQATAEVELRRSNPALWLKIRKDLSPSTSLPRRDGPAGMRHARIVALKRYEEVHDRLAEGQSPTHVARIIHDEMHELLDFNREDLARRLRRYRAEVIGVILEDDQDDAAAREREIIEAKFKNRIDLFEQYNWLVNVQSERVRLMFHRERAGGGREAFGFKDVDALRQTLDSVAKLQLDIGMLRRAPIEVDTTIRRGTDEGGDYIERSVRDDALRFSAFRQAAKLLRESLRTSIDVTPNGGTPPDDTGPGRS